MSIEYYKGYTQHLRSISGDDVDINDVRTMDMVPGLYLMKLAAQEGYVLPVCKYINNYRSGVVNSFKVSRDESEPCQHPCHNYAIINDEAEGDQKVKLINLMMYPEKLAGGIVCINNLMESTGFKRYTKLDSGNLGELVLDGCVKLVFTYSQRMSSGEQQCLIMKVLKSCVYRVDKLEYHMEFEMCEDGSYKDFTSYVTVV